MPPNPDRTEYVSVKQIMAWSTALIMMLGGWLFSTLISSTRETKIAQDKKDARQDIQIESNRLRIQAATEHEKEDAAALQVKDKEQDGRLQANERNIDRLIDAREED